MAEQPLVVFDCIDRTSSACILYTALLTGGESMPQVFKALASISAWILFIAGCLNFVVTLVTLPIGGVTAQEWIHTAAFFLIATISVMFAVVAMKLRQMME